MCDDPNDFAKDPAAAQVLDFIRAGLWRKARDAAKDLCKKDRGRYLDLLIRANVGLVREMLGKGLLKEAETVVVYLATFAPADTMAMLRAEMAAPTSKRQVAVLADSGGAGWWVAALRADEVATKGGAVFPADQAAVDLLVTDAFEPDAVGNEGQAVRLVAELKAVRAACTATGEGRWAEAKNALRDLPRQSVFWQWRIFLRGVRCAFEEERETARQCFAQLPPSGALARAAASLAPDLAGCTRPAPATATVPLYLAATGQSAVWAAPILAASTSWKAGKRIQAFDDLVTGMKAEFPSVVPGLPSILTDSILPSHARMNDGDWVDSEALFTRFVSGRVKVKSQLPTSVLAFIRSMCVAEKDEMPHEELDRSWRQLIELWQKRHGPDGQRDSLAWQWLGDALGNPAALKSNPFDYEGGEKCKHAANAIKAYENAIAADEANEPARLGLVSLLIRQGDTKRSNKMLDELVKKFPRNKGILILAGDSATARKSYAKGIGFLRTALALDPLNKELKERIVVTLTLQVRNASRKGASTADLWAEIEPLLENSPPRGHDMLSRWMARVRRALLETEPETAAQAEADAVAMAPSGLVRVFFTTTLASVYGLPPRKEWEREWNLARSSPECTWKSLLEILRILDFTTAISGWGWKQTTLAGDRVLKLVEHLVVPRRLKEDPDGALAFFDELKALHKRASQHSSQVFGLVNRDISDAFQQHVDPGDKKTDPRLRLASLLRSTCEPKKALKYLKAIIADAEAAGLQAVVTRARELQKIIESHSSHQPLGFLTGERDDDEDNEEDYEDDEEDIWEDEDDEDDESASATMSSEQYMEELKKAITAGDVAAVRQIRDALIGIGISQLTVDTTVKILTRTAGSTTKTKKPAKTPVADPRQIDLF